MTNSAHPKATTIPKREGKQDLQKVLDDVLKMLEEEMFTDLPNRPDGIVLSRQGALRATEKAAWHYYQEKVRLSASPMSSAVTRGLKELGLRAAKASRFLQDASSNIEAISTGLKGLGGHEADRLRMVPSSYLRQIFEDIKKSEGRPVLEMDYQDIATHGSPFLSDADSDVLQSEILRFLDSDRGTPYSPSPKSKEIERLRSLSIVCLAAANLKGAADKPGKHAYLEFHLDPSYQLVEGCIAILQASGLDHGRRKEGGNLIELADLIRTSMDPASKSLASAVGKLSKKTTDRLPRLKGRITYWVYALLIEDLETVADRNSTLVARLAQLQEKRRSLHGEISEKAVVVANKASEGGGYLKEYSPWMDIDDASPFYVV